MPANLRINKILIIQTAFIGDVILATGLIENLKASYPNASIDFLLRRGNESLLKDHPKLNKVLVWNKQQGKFKNLLQLTLQIRRNKYDLIVNLQRFASSGLICAFSNAKHIVGFDKNPLSWFFHKKASHVIGAKSDENVLHEVDRNFNLISHLSHSKIKKPKLYPSEKDIEACAVYQNDKYICLAPSSVWFTKQMIKHKWVELIGNIDPSIKVYLLGAKSDIEYLKDISSGHKNVINLAGKMSLLQSAQLMKGAIMNYVNDSAPMHLASSLNAPVTAIFCSTIPQFGFGPLSAKSFVIEEKTNLSCRPCGLHGKKECPEGHFNCAEKIDTNRLLDTIPK